MIGVSNSIHQTNSNAVSGGTVSIGAQLDLGTTMSTVTLTSAVVTGPGTYTVFQTGSGIVWNGSTLPAGADLTGKVNFQVPSGYAVQSATVDSTGLNVKVVVRRAAIA